MNFRVRCSNFCFIKEYREFKFVKYFNMRHFWTSSKGKILGLLFAYQIWEFMSIDCIKMFYIHTYDAAKIFEVSSIYNVDKGHVEQTDSDF